MKQEHDQKYQIHFCLWLFSAVILATFDKVKGQSCSNHHCNGRVADGIQNTKARIVALFSIFTDFFYPLKYVSMKLFIWYEKDCSSVYVLIF